MSTRFCSSIFILALTLSLLGALSRPVGAVLICGSPGAAGNGTPSGVINDYWPGSGSPTAGSGSVTVGPRRAGGAGNSINAGDLVLIIQMQDADIDSSNTTNYGATNGTGSGATAVNSSGLYEYVLATNTIGAVGGTLNFTPALTNNYRSRAYATTGQSTWQVVRVLQYSSATASNVTAPSWDGATGGLVAMDVENTLTLSGTTSINVDGLGFRGGAGRMLGGAAGYLDTDFRTISTVNTNAAKGEGIAGLPRYINNTTSYNAAPTIYNTGAEGYPNGSSARGAPGNAGGGGTDGNPPGNDQNSGGGGGSNYGFGGVGGDAWSSGDPSGGRGGAAYAGTLAFNRVFLGGGGGAGTTNNGTNDTATYTAPPGLACTPTDGSCSSGATGGGIVLIRAGSISGSGVITARGADGYNVLNDGAGGGGAGGTVVLQSYFTGSATVNVSGGNGGNAWRSHTIDIDRHGPGGGGGGGFIAYSPSTGFTVTATYNAGLPGRTSNNQTFGSTSGNGGITTYDLPNIPGIQPGTFCPPAIKGVSLAVDNGVAGAIDIGDTLEYTVVYRNGSSGAIYGFNINDSLPAAVSYVAGSLNVTPSGGASGSTNGSYNGGASTSLLASNVTLPTGGIITAKLRATANGPICSVVYNHANSVQSSGDDLGQTDNADNTQNEGGLPSGTYISQTPYGISGATDQTGFTVACPDFSTSTKSWVDLNGGDQEPGDTLRYTITIQETGGGSVSGVSVTDDIPADVNSFSLVSIPAGATNSSTYSGTGSNSNGYLNITNITVTGGSSVTIVYDLIINSGATPGTIINNTATITTPLGTGGTPDAPPLTVSSSYIPGTGTKLLYLYGTAARNADKLSRTINPSTDRVNFATLGTQTWTMNPVAAADITIDPAVNSTVPVWLRLRRESTSGNRTIKVDLQCSSGGPILSNTRVINLNGTETNYNFNLPTAPDPAWTTPITCAAGNSWLLTVSIIANTQANGMRLYFNTTAANRSRIELPASTVINVDSIAYYDAPVPGGNLLTSFPPGQVVYIRTVVSDPFGNYDINANNNATTLPTITITNPSGTNVVTAAAMTERTTLRTAGTETFEYGPYTVNDLGNWTVRVDADEGTEGTVSDFGIGSFTVVVPMPSLLVVKSSQNYSDPINGTTSPKAIPGAFVTYTIQVTNSGPGAVDTGTTVITDKIPTNTELFVGDFDGAGPVLGPVSFTNGSTVSGLSYTFTNLASITDNLTFSDNNGVNYNKINTTPDSNGCDPTVTHIQIPLSGVFNGAVGGNNPSFSIQFRVRIK